MTEVFAHMGNLLEDRGTKVDAHVHMIDAGYLALLLALVQPYVALSSSTVKRFSQNCFWPAGSASGWDFSHSLCGLAYSPFPVIGWASILADSAGAMLIAFWWLRAGVFGTVCAAAPVPVSPSCLGSYLGTPHAVVGRNRCWCCSAFCMGPGMRE